jgi:hypothetical protein
MSAAELETRLELRLWTGEVVEVPLPADRDELEQRVDDVLRAVGGQPHTGPFGVEVPAPAFVWLELAGVLRGVPARHVVAVTITDG